MRGPTSILIVLSLPALAACGSGTPVPAYPPPLDPPFEETELYSYTGRDVPQDEWADEEPIDDAALDEEPSAEEAPDAEEEGGSQAEPTSDGDAAEEADPQGERTQ